MASISPSTTTTTQALWQDGNFAFSDTRYNVSGASGVWASCPQLAALDPGTAITYFDDFFTYDDTATVGGYAEVSDAGTIVTTDAVGGVLSVPTGGTDNNETYVSSIHELFKVADDKPIWFEARVKLTEANTDDANIIVGLSDTVGANTLLDNGGGPAASYDGIVFAKVDGGTVWQFETSNAGTQVTTASAGAFASGEWTRLGFHVNPTSATAATVTPYIDGVAGTTHALTITGLEEMHILLGAKAGGGNAETLLVDYVKCVQVR